MKRRTQIVILTVCCIALVACSSSGTGPAVQGELAPDFTFKDQAGKQYPLADFRGKVVLVNFWATWCPPCREEMPSLEQLQHRMAQRPFTILALSVDDSWEPVNRFMKENGLGLTIYDDFDKKASTLYGSFKYPETYIVDKKGKVAYKIVGPTDWVSSEMLKFLDVLVTET
jgi:peroxiredoxin